MGGFLGSYRHTFDAKGRIALPASFRRGREEDAFVLVHAQKEALSLYPLESWAEVEQNLREMSKRKPEYRPMVLGITANAHEIALDKQGRILVPDRLREVVGLGSEALIIGALDRIEIWEPARFEKASEKTTDEFDRFVASIFA